MEPQRLWRLRGARGRKVEGGQMEERLAWEKVGALEEGDGVQEGGKMEEWLALEQVGAMEEGDGV